MILLKIGNFYCRKVFFLAESQKNEVVFELLLIFRFLETS